MSKTLAETAAEILRATQVAASRAEDPMIPVGIDPNQILGGSDISGNVEANGLNASNERPVAPRPGVTVAPGESQVENEMDDESDEDESDESEDEVNPNVAMKEHLLSKFKGSMKEDIEAMLGGEGLSEDFRNKATVIFEAAVQSRLDSIVEELLEDNQKILSEAYDAMQTDLATKVDNYLSYAAQEWISENKVAVEVGLKNELTEEFMTGLKKLFEDHYIEIPEDKVDVAQELANRVNDLQEQISANNLVIDSLGKELNETKKNDAIRKICEGLSQVQVAKMKTLAESVEFTTEGEFNKKLAVIRENYFPIKKVESEVKVVNEDAQAQPEVVNNTMNYYVRAISKSLPK
jgi:hypothetical protein